MRLQLIASAALVATVALGAHDACAQSDEPRRTTVSVRVYTDDDRVTGADGKARPKAITVGNSGVGSHTHISAVALFTLVQPEHGGPRSALIAFILLVGAEQFMSSVVEPRLIGRSLNLSPLVILLSLSVWGSLWGFAGALLAVPMTVSVMIVLTQFRATRPFAILMSDSGVIAPMRRADA